LDVTKIETKNLKLNKELVNLDDLVSDIIEDYNNQLDKENVKITSSHIYHNKSGESANKRDTEEVEEGKINNISIIADKTRINQVISNLLNNAIKFTDAGIIDLVIEKPDDKNKVFINIKDTGCGIDPSIFPKLFSKFVTKSEEGGGTGLGLYISKNIIESHGGKIWATNNKDGKGCTFGFSLPIVNC
jgi:signal transduction histidine kinase